MRETILVTGAATGIGKETALYLAERGFQVYATVRDGSQADTVYASARERGTVLATSQPGKRFSRR